MRHRAIWLAVFLLLVCSVPVAVYFAMGGSLKLHQIPEIPVYPRAQLVQALHEVAMQEQGHKTSVMSFVTSGEPSNITDFYEEALQSGGWKYDQCGRFFRYTRESPFEEYTLWVNTDQISSQCAVTITVSSLFDWFYHTNPDCG